MHAQVSNLSLSGERQKFNGVYAIVRPLGSQCKYLLAEFTTGCKLSAACSRHSQHHANGIEVLVSIIYYLTDQVHVTATVRILIFQELPESGHIPK